MASSYSFEDFVVRETVEHIRHRPAMYIGSVDEAGLRFLLTDVLEDLTKNQVTDLKVKEANGLVTISGQGKAPSPEMHPKIKKSYLEVACTTLAAGGRYPFDSLTMLNALSSFMLVRIKHLDRSYLLVFENGRNFFGGLQTFQADPDEPALQISFKPDAEIFKLATLTQADIQQVIDNMEKLELYNQQVLAKYHPDQNS